MDVTHVSTGARALGVPSAGGPGQAPRPGPGPDVFAAALANASAPADAASADTVWVDGGDCRCGVGDGAARLGPDGVPGEYRAFGAGRIPAASLEPVGAAGVVLWPPAAASVRALTQAAAADGLRVEAVAGYRAGDPSSAWGTRVDLRHDDAARPWLVARAAAFGLVPAGGTAWSYRPTH